MLAANRIRFFRVFLQVEEEEEERGGGGGGGEGARWERGAWGCQKVWLIIQFWKFQFPFVLFLSLKKPKFECHRSELNSVSGKSQVLIIYRCKIQNAFDLLQCYVVSIHLPIKE